MAHVPILPAARADPFAFANAKGFATIISLIGEIKSRRKERDIQNVLLTGIEEGRTPAETAGALKGLDGGGGNFLDVLNPTTSARGPIDLQSHVSRSLFTRALQEQPDQFAGLGLTQPERRQAGRIEAGLTPRAVQPTEPFAGLGLSDTEERTAGRIKAGIDPRAVAPKTTQRSSVIVDPQDASRTIRVMDTFDEQGKLTNRQFIGEATLPEKVGDVDPTIFTQLQKPVAAGIQKELKDATIDIANLEDIAGSFRDEFSEIPFRIGQEITVAREKLGKLDPGRLIGRPVTAEQKQTLSEFASWRRNAQREFVVFKKWATGVAAGQKEMAEQIELAFPSALKDSPTEFKSKIDSAIKVRQRTRDILTQILNSGTVLNARDKKQAEQQALRQALSEVGVEGQQGAPSPAPLDAQLGDPIQQETTSLLAPDKKARLEELRRKRGQ